MKKISASLACILYILTSITAQKNYLPGSIVLNSNDTIKGFIDYRNWERNPANISFKSSQETPPQVYGLNDIRFFNIENNDSYTRAIVPIDGNSVDIITATTYKNDLIVFDTVFLRILSKGPAINFFEFIDSKRHYYAQTNDGPIEELIYKADASSGIVRYSYIFRDQLNAKLFGRQLGKRRSLC